METITKSYQVYKYEELSDSAQEKVRCMFGEDSGEFETDCLLDDFTEQLKEKYPYFLNPEFQWSAGGCQGDGLSFLCDIDVSLFLDKECPNMKRFLKDIISNELYVSSTGNTGHYCYSSENQVVSSFYGLNEYPKIQEKLEDVFGLITEKYADVCHEFYINARNAYEYLYTEEYAQETCDGNEYTFLEDGSMFNE